jgi:hypothetical protein
MRVQDDDRLPGELLRSVALPYLASFFGVSPFPWDPMVDARLDLLYRNAMEKLDEVDDEGCIKYVSRKMLALYTVTKYPPKNDGAAAAVEASAPPPRTPDRPAAAADEHRPKRGMALSNDESEATK